MVSGGWSEEGPVFDLPSRPGPSVYPLCSQSSVSSGSDSILPVPFLRIEVFGHGNSSLSGVVVIGEQSVVVSADVIRGDGTWTISDDDIDCGVITVALIDGDAKLDLPSIIDTCPQWGPFAHRLTEISDDAFGADGDSWIGEIGPGILDVILALDG